MTVLSELIEVSINSKFPSHTYQDHLNILLAFSEDNIPQLSKDITTPVYTALENEKNWELPRIREELTIRYFKEQKQLDEEELETNKLNEHRYRYALSEYAKIKKQRKDTSLYYQEQIKKLNQEYQELFLELQNQALSPKNVKDALTNKMELIKYNLSETQALIADNEKLDIAQDLQKNLIQSNLDKLKIKEEARVIREKSRLFSPRSFDQLSPDNRDNLYAEIQNRGLLIEDRYKMRLQAAPFDMHSFYLDKVLAKIKIPGAFNPLELQILSKVTTTLVEHSYLSMRIERCTDIIKFDETIIQEDELKLKTILSEQLNPTETDKVRNDLNMQLKKIQSIIQSRLEELDNYRDKIKFRSKLILLSLVIIISFIIISLTTPLPYITPFILLGVFSAIASTVSFLFLKGHQVSVNDDLKSQETRLKKIQTDLAKFVAGKDYDKEISLLNSRIKRHTEDITKYTETIAELKQNVRMIQKKAIQYGSNKPVEYIHMFFASKESNKPLPPSENLLENSNKVNYTGVEPKKY